MVICLERDADLHMAQLMPLLLAVSCFSKIQIGFWYWLTRVVPEKGPLNGCVCVCCHKSQLPIQLTSCWRHLWWQVWRQCLLINKQHVIKRGSSFNKNVESWKRIGAYGAKRLMSEFPRQNWSLAAVKCLLQKIDATGSSDPQNWQWSTSHVIFQ